MKAILKISEWRRFLEVHPEFNESLWDLIPKEMEVVDQEELVWTGTNLYHLEYLGKKWVVWPDEIEEFIE